MGLLADAVENAKQTCHFREKCSHLYFCFVFVPRTTIFLTEIFVFRRRRRQTRTNVLSLRQIF